MMGNFCNQVGFINIAIFLLMIISQGNANVMPFDISRIEPIADKSIRTGNKVLVEREIKQNYTRNDADDDDDDDDDMNDNYHEPDASENEWMLDVNEIPVRYDEAQLWRIYNISDSLRQAYPIGAMMENKFGGTIWKENSKFLDISINKENVKAARSFLTAHNLQTEVLNRNIQELIDAELMDGILGTESEPGQRTSKLHFNFNFKGC